MELAVKKITSCAINSAFRENQNFMKTLHVFGHLMIKEPESAHSDILVTCSEALLFGACPGLPA